MTINLSVPGTADAVLKPRITVIGVGGAGGNAVNNMIDSKLEGVEFLVANTDSQALSQSLCERRLQLGLNITHGLGAGSRPDIGRAAAEEAIDDLIEHLKAAHMVFITAGMGGGTGTGAAPVIARLAREHGILTVGVVTKPFQFEGANRMRLADAGIDEMQQYVDTLIVIPNQNLFRVANEKTTFADAFTMADEVLHSGVRGVTDLMVVPGLINLDFADIRTVMSEMGKAMMGTGEATGEERAREAAEAAISNPLLDEVSMRGARGVLINITGGPDMTLFEVDEAANRIGDEVDSDANIIFGSTMDESLEGKMRVSVVATGIDAEVANKPRPVLKVYTQDERKPEPVVIPDSAPQSKPIRQAPISASTSAARETTVVSGPAAEGNDIREPAKREPVGGGIPHPSTEAFVPPPPMDPRGRTEPDSRPDPFREADMINGGTAPDRKRGGLLARVTGAARARKEEAKREEDAPAAEPIEPIFEPSLEARPVVQPEQPQLVDVDHDDATGRGHSEDDLLDIPAFLRRQAN
jgi:cell division protein FtsZ